MLNNYIKDSCEEESLMRNFFLKIRIRRLAYKLLPTLIAVDKKEGTPYVEYMDEAYKIARKSILYVDNYKY